MAQISTFNLDFNVCLGKQQTDLFGLIAARDPEIICVQEARDTNLKQILPGTYGTNQVMKDEGTRGSAIIWKKSAFTNVGPSKLIVGADAMNMHRRYMSMQTLTHTSGNKIRVVSLHMPLKTKYAAAHQAMIANVFKMIDNFKIDRFVIGADWNFNIPNDPHKIKKKTGLVSRGGSIDGFFLTNSLSPGSIQTGPVQFSDHSPRTISISIG
jgi:hypothetical protein